MPKAWRDPCAKCSKAAFMLCITCESMEKQLRTKSIMLKVRKNPEHKERKSCVGTTTQASGSSSESA